MRLGVEAESTTKKTIRIAPGGSLLAGGPRISFPPKNGAVSRDAGFTNVSTSASLIDLVRRGLRRWFRDAGMSGHVWGEEGSMTVHGTR